MNIESEKLSVPRFMTLFRKLSRADQLKIADRISRQTFAERWKILDAEMPDVRIGDDKIIEELTTFRHGKKKNL